MKKIGFSIQAQWVEYEIQLSSFDESPEKVKRISDLILDRYKLKVLNFNGRLEKNTIVSVSCSGGEASLVSDLSENMSLKFPKFSKEKIR